MSRRTAAPVILVSTSIMFCLSFSAYADYPLAKINNRTIYPAAGVIKYASAFCKNDSFSVPAGQLQKDGSIKPGFWQARSRGVCLITGIDAQLHGANKGVVSYSSSGTSYSNFIIQGTQTDYRVWSDHELAAENARSREGKSPGFHIVNQTTWPVSVALSQVGCLYYDTLQPGEVFDRNTGAVWFTIKANIQPDGKEPRSDWDCVKPVAAVVGAVALAAATGGYGAFAALPAATAATSIGAAGLAGIATSSSVLVAAGAAGGATMAVVTFGAKQLGELLSKNGAGEEAGQYAGPEWPFRCDQKPVYYITGGPSKTVVNGQMLLGQGTPLQIRKQNTCGNSMMSSSAVVPGATARVNVVIAPEAAAAGKLARVTPIAPAAPATTSAPVSGQDFATNLAGSRWTYVYGGNTYQFDFGKQTIDNFSNGWWPGVTWRALAQNQVILTNPLTTPANKQMVLTFSSPDRFTGTDWDGRTAVSGGRATPAQSAAPAGTKGMNVTAVEFGQGGAKFGEFRQTGPKQWAEVPATGPIVFRFEETQRDEWSVYMVDRSRGVNLQLDLHTRKVMFSDAQSPRRVLYDILSAGTPAVP